jgi:hypothetical protein
MYKGNREKRVRTLVKTLNNKRKAQAAQIDILCNDLIEAQRNFIGQLSTINFAANFYKSIVGIGELDSLLCAAAKLLKEETCNEQIAFLLRRDESFDLHSFSDDHPAEAAGHLEQCFTDEVVINICKSSKVCSLEEMLEVGLQVPPALLDKTWAVTVPLKTMANCFGFLLICGSTEPQLAPQKIEHIQTVTPGLARAITACKKQHFLQRN